MWEIEVTARADKLYQALQNEFDAKHVPKKTRSFKVHRRGETHEFEKEVAVPDEGSAMQFRRILKFVQTCDLTGNVLVTCGGDGKKSLFVNVGGA